MNSLPVYGLFYPAAAMSLEAKETICILMF